MTIKALKKYLTDKYGHLKKTACIYKFRKCKISIDASYIAYQYWFPMQNRVIDQLRSISEDVDVDTIVQLWLQNIWNLISKFLRYGITPVIVFDGEPPAEKSAVIAERREKKDIAKTNLERFKAEIKGMDKFSQNTYLTKMKALYKDCGFLNQDHFALLKTFFNGLGLPVLQAKNEAEELCAALCRDGYVSAVYCEDVDSLAHLAPCWIYEKNEKKEYVEERREYVESFNFMIMDEILNSINMTKETFVDFCIMCGCDYNTNIKGIGPDKSYKALLKAKSIDALPSNYDVKILNHIRCRELFSCKKSSDICTNKINWDNPTELSVDKNCINTYSNSYLSGCKKEDLIHELDFIYAAFPDEIIKLDYSQFIISPEVLTRSELGNVTGINLDNIKLDLSNIDFSKLTLGDGNPNTNTSASTNNNINTNNNTNINNNINTNNNYINLDLSQIDFSKIKF
jgi:flap endonuclease-1